MKYDEAETPSKESIDSAQPEPKVFSLPIDSEGKSKVLRLWSLQHPHHTAFHLSWLAVSSGDCSVEYFRLHVHIICIHACEPWLAPWAHWCMRREHLTAG